MSDHVSILAAGRGNPTINFSDGHQLLTAYVGPEEFRMALEQNRAEPLSLASADFDEDGVPDLISGYSYNGQGIVTLLRGNVDSIYPNAPEAKQRKAHSIFTDAPFLSPGQVFAAPVEADFIGAGDFDGDSHWDVVAATRGNKELWLLPGDGRGNLGAARRIDLPGQVTTLVTGEINRADGLTDVVVGVVTADGPKVLVFESPDGALRGKPETFELPGKASAMALGRLDGDYTMDLAVGAGNDLVVLYGRDRRLSLDEIRQAEVPKASIGRRSFSFGIKSVAVGDFTGEQRAGLSLWSDDGAVYSLSRGTATGDQRKSSDRVEEWQNELLTNGPWARASQVVSGRVSGSAGDDLVALDSVNHKVHIIRGSVVPGKTAMVQLPLDVVGEPMAVLPMRLNGDALSDLVILRKEQSAPSIMVTQPLATFTVTNTNDSGAGSLRQAIADANATAGLDMISFSIGSGVKTISVGSTTGMELPPITSPVIIDGTTQPGFAGSPLIELNGTSAFMFANGLYISAGSCTVKGLVINRFRGNGIRILTSGGNVVTGNFIGTDVSGTVDLEDTGSGFSITSAGNTIGGTAVSARNLISGYEFGVNIGPSGATGNLVQGNYIGTEVSGTAKLSTTGDGVAITSSGNTIGGTAAGARNIISGNVNGIEMVGGAATGNLVQGNFIGTDVNGTADLGNAYSGVRTTDHNNTIGGSAASARNVISGNEVGIALDSGSTGSLVQGNFIGTDVNGIADLGNSIDGLFIRNTENCAIGGTAVGARNIISGNNGYGIEMFTGFGDGDVVNSALKGNLVQGNFIGTDVSGTADLGNNFGGAIFANSSRNTIGGDTVGARNVISGNGRAGIVLYGGPSGSRGPFESVENKIQGNFIGTNATGSAKLGNDSNGIEITIVNSGANNTIGGSSSGARNIISGNNGNGIAIGIRVSDPLLPGTGGTGITVQNNYLGIDVSGQDRIGNTLDGLFVDANSFDNTFRDNLISSNGRNGVFIPQNDNPGVRIFMDNNAVFGNAALGIDLGLAGITANDALDVDSGANLQQNFPVLTSFGPAAAKQPDALASALMSRNPEATGKPIAPEANATVSATLNSTPNTPFTVHWYFSADSACAANQASSRPLVTGRIPNVMTNGSGNASFDIPLEFPAGMNNGIINCTATDPQGNTSEFSACLPVTAPPWQPVVLTAAQIAEMKAWTVNGRTSVYVKPQFPDAGYRVTNWGQASRAGNDLAVDAAVEKFHGSSIQAVTTTAQIYDLGPLANGTYNFNFKTSGTSAKTLQFTVSSIVPPANPIDDARQFVKQQYRDFLNRESDQAGEDFWTDNITKCTDPARRPPGQTVEQCTLRQRETTTGAFYQSPEFQYTGYFVYRMYQGALGRQPKLSEFIPDAQFVGNGIIVNGQLSGAKINQNKAALAAQFVNCTDAAKYRCAEFKAIYDGLSNQAYVDKLFQTTGVNASAGDRAALVNGLNANPATETRASVLQKVVDGVTVIGEGNQQFTTTYGQAFYNGELNRAFVQLEYFGYMKRDPDEAGYGFWLDKLNTFGGNFVNAEMVLAFISSPEYRARFGQP